ncbi:hypothetical protein CH275_17435 [Rhodococcus sp. 06-235-1A]|uniref:DUF262 domain-containing protein n=1 Tax=Rhodococcus sp. 06-235-1A TaxID=2022508 RepID=UPI000B9ABB45|nr:DUF262 domain-containing protein [Rhodococcus sp. 06-235-1A]OZD02417.1 hypothetical protein CH275_17435 [Rhodococcus sp. 06-235-1A]
MKVKSDDKNIGDLLSSAFFKVPRFQRPFEWTAAEIDEFWDDLNDADSDYFIGSMVLFQSTHGIQGIVDGQQRLTTITLLLCELRDAFRANSLPDEAAGLQQLIERPSIRDNQRHFVLQKDQDSPYLRHLQQDMVSDTEPQPADGESLIKKGSARIRTHLSGALQGNLAQKQKKLTELREQILGLRLVTIEVDNEEDATVIFQTLNSRGRDLETADLVKSHLLSHLRAGNAQNDIPRERWNTILNEFDQSSAELPVDRFLLHSWLSRRDYLAQAALGKSVRKTVKRNQAQKFLDELVLDSRLYREIHEPAARSTWALEELPLRQSLQALQVFRVKQPLPWVLALWREYDQGLLRLKYVLPAIQAVERFHFINTAVTNSPSSGGVSKMYASHARQITAARSVNAKAKVIREMNAKLASSDRLPSLDQFSADFRRIRNSKVFTKQARLTRYILNSLHDSQSASPADPNRMTIEHLAPQSAKQPGVGLLDAAKIGNLLLVPQDLNNQMDTKTFSEKLSMLQASAAKGLYVDDSILNATQWTKAEIDSRSTEMAKHAYETVWSIKKLIIPGSK